MSQPVNPDPDIRPVMGVDFLRGGGNLGALMRGKDWSSTPLGRPESWPQSLRTVVRIMLDSRYSMWMGWGSELIFLYNDAYARDTLGKKHPWALGRPAREVWAEIWSDIGPRIDRVLGTGEATWDSGLLLFLERSGYTEESYHTFSYSPLYDDGGNISGMFCVVTEETERIVAERRAILLREMASALTGTKTRTDVLAAIERCLATATRALPFTLLYLTDGETDHARLVCRTGIDATHPAARVDGANAWPLDQVLATNGTRVIDTLGSYFENLPSGAWQKPPIKAILAPVPQQGHPRPAGVFVAGLNPHRPLDEGYRGFIDLLVGQIAAALANASAYEEERNAPRRWPRLTAPRRRFFRTSATSFARR